MTFFTRLRKKVTIHSPFNLKASLSIEFSPYVPTGKTIPTSGGIAIQSLPPFENQFNVGQCTMATSCEIRMINQIKSKKSVIRPSEIFGYHMGVNRLGNPTEDSGLDGKTMMDINCLDGLPPNVDWPSESHLFTDVPPKEIIDKAKLYCATQAQKMSSMNDVLDCLGNRQEPVFVAVVLHQSFMTEKVAKTGIAPNPSWWSWLDPQVGGHEMTAVSYDKKTGYLDCLNHWVRSADGTLWGKNGHALLKLNYPDFMEFWRLVI